MTIRPKNSGLFPGFMKIQLVGSLPHYHFSRCQKTSGDLLPFVKRETFMITKYAYVGIIRIIVGLFEILVTPLILQRLWVKRPPPHSAYILLMIRMSGLIVVILGLSFLLGLFDLPTWGWLLLAFLLGRLHKEGESVRPLDLHLLSFFNWSPFCHHLRLPKFAMDSNISQRIEALLCDAFSANQGS